jgi:hypothetical protein
MPTRELFMTHLLDAGNLSRSALLPGTVQNPLSRMRMLDGFNEGWLSFEHEPIKGEVELDTVLGALIERDG